MYDSKHGKDALHKITGHGGGSGESHESLHKIEDGHHKKHKK